MKILCKDKDGGPESKVWAYWLIEYKPLFSIALLKFVGNSRPVYHTHAFNSISWLLKGKLREEFVDTYRGTKIYKPSIIPIKTPRGIFHKVSSQGTSWVITLRGPWDKSWLEHSKKEGTYTLTNGRKRI